MPDSASSASENTTATSPVLVATDFSADSEAALLWAARNAALTKAPLTVLHVVHDPADAAGFYRRDEEDAQQSMTEIAEEMMASFLKKMQGANPDLKPLQNAASMIVAGLPPGRIVEVAEREGARLIVVGSRGRTGLSHILVGSVAERVAQLASMPVVIVKHQAGN